MGNKNINISVIIPTYNRSQLLRRSIRSVLNQTLQPREIIVVDNGSTDDTSDMISKSFKNIRYIYHDKKGVSAARNKGIKISKSNWVSFLDSDDEWVKDKLLLQKEYILKNPNVNFLHTNETWFKNGKHLNQKKKHKKYSGYIFENCLKLCCISPSSTLIKKKLFDKIGYFDESFEVCEDYELWLRVSSKIKIHFLEDKLTIKHGGHCGQLSRKHWGMDRFRIMAIEKNILNNWFNEEQKIHAIKDLISKIKIILNGAKNRNNKKIFNQYQKKLFKWKS
tara:strand:+ start:334 stop:1170 length:837 start_codon:yes stop_codon:yes gene_type:complete